MKPIYNPKAVADQLGIKESTLRKYAILLEDHGYTFHKNERDHRAYYDGDVIAIRKLMTLKNDTDMTLENAADSVVTWSKGEIVLPDDTLQSERHDVTLIDTGTLLERIDQQNNLIQELIKHNARMEEKREKEIEEIKKENKLLQDELKEIKNVMTSLHTTNKEIAAALQKKRSFWDLFKK